MCAVRALAPDEMGNPLILDTPGGPQKGGGRTGSLPGHMCHLCSFLSKRTWRQCSDNSPRPRAGPIPPQLSCAWGAAAPEPLSTIMITDLTL